MFPAFGELHGVDSASLGVSEGRGQSSKVVLLCYPLPDVDGLRIPRRDSIIDAKKAFRFPGCSSPETPAQVGHSCISLLARREDGNLQSPKPFKLARLGGHRLVLDTWRQAWADSVWDASVPGSTGGNSALSGWRMPGLGGPFVAHLWPFVAPRW